MIVCLHKKQIPLLYLTLGTRGRGTLISTTHGTTFDRPSDGKAALYYRLFRPLCILLHLAISSSQHTVFYNRLTFVVSSETVTLRLMMPLNHFLVIILIPKTGKKCVRRRDWHQRKSTKTLPGALQKSVWRREEE